MRGATVLLHIRDLLSGMVKEEKQLKKTMLENIDRYKEEISLFTSKLSLPHYDQEQGMTIMQQEKDLR